MMNCPNCKQPLAVGKKFCTNCGCPADAPYFFDANALGIGFTDVLTKKYACFRGRARRKEFWMFFLFTCIIHFVLLVLVPFIFLPGLGRLLCFVYLCGMGIPELGVTIRRFHDTGRNSSFAWLFVVLWFLLASQFFVLVIESLMFSCSPSLISALIKSGLLLGLPFVVFIRTCFDSQPGPNKYGPNPKGM